eukprot:scaffold232738_cov15-Prasinocladus_malaysianus.AAC.1
MVGVFTLVWEISAGGCPKLGWLTGPGPHRDLTSRVRNDIALISTMRQQPSRRYPQVGAAGADIDRQTADMKTT